MQSKHFRYIPANTLHTCKHKMWWIRVPEVPFCFFYLFFASFFFFFFLINWNAKLEIKFWFLFLYWSWDIKHKTKWFFDFQNNWTLKFKYEVRFSFFHFNLKNEKRNPLKPILMKLVTISPHVITIKKYEMIK